MNDTATPTSAGRIVTEVQGPVLLIGIDRAAKRNGFTPAMMQALAEAYTRLDDDPALRVGLLHAEGAHFTAGLDLPSFAPLMQRGERAIAPGLVDPTDLGPGTATWLGGTGTVLLGGFLWLRKWLSRDATDRALTVQWTLPTLASSGD